MITIFSDVFVFDGLEGELIGPAHVVVEGDRRSATSVNAELLQKSGELGQITAGALLSHRVRHWHDRPWARLMKS